MGSIAEGGFLASAPYLVGLHTDSSSFLLPPPPPSCTTPGTLCNFLTLCNFSPAHSHLPNWLSTSSPPSKMKPLPPRLLAPCI